MRLRPREHHSREGSGRALVPLLPIDIDLLTFVISRPPTQNRASATLLRFGGPREVQAGWGVPVRRRTRRLRSALDAITTAGLRHPRQQAVPVLQGGGLAPEHRLRVDAKVLGARPLQLGP